MHRANVTLLVFLHQPPGVVVTESQTYKKRSDFQSNDDYAVYVRENIQVRAVTFSRVLQSTVKKFE